MRRRAGHGWRYRLRDGKPSLHEIFGEVSGWIPSGKARGWSRCPRCRKPIEAKPFDSDVCVHCYFYSGRYITVEEFWRIHNTGHPLAPYNIGKRVVETIFNATELQRENP